MRKTRSNILILVLTLILLTLLLLTFILWNPFGEAQPKLTAPYSTEAPSAATSQRHEQTQIQAATLPQESKSIPQEPETPVVSETPAGWPVIEVEDDRSTAAVPYRINGVILVNRKHKVNWDYRPEVTQRGHIVLAPEAFQAFEEMKEAAQKENLVFSFRSGYRDFATQVAIYNQYLRTDPEGERGVNRYSAPPGASEHQTGLAVDIDEGEGLSYEFDKRPVGKWLLANAYRYGFILRFPKGKEGITGYNYEPWHFRYVGKEIAAEFGPNNTLTLEEYLGAEPAPSPFANE